MRLFIGIDFDEKIKIRLSEITNKILNAGINGSATRQENFHITLKFLGEVERSGINDISRAVDTVCADFPLFSATILRLGVFKRQQGSIIYAGLDKCLSLEALSDKISRKLVPIGFSYDNHDYNPHITLLRSAYGDINKIQTLAFEPLLIQINEVTLFNSVRIGGKLTYEPIFISKLHEGTVN